MKYLISALFALFATQNIAYPWYGNMGGNCPMPCPTVIMVNPKIKIKMNKKIVLPKSRKKNRSWDSGASTGWNQASMMSSPWRSQWGC
jgi:hypothetical protein